MKLVNQFWISSFIVELWCDLLNSMAVASNPESSKEQIPHNRLLINMTVQSVQQIRLQPECNPVYGTAKATQAYQLSIPQIMCIEVAT